VTDILDSASKSFEGRFEGLTSHRGRCLLEPGLLDTFVTSGKTKRSTRKPKPRWDFIGAKFFGPEKVFFFHLTGTLYGCQPNTLPALFFFDTLGITLLYVQIYTKPANGTKSRRFFICFLIDFCLIMC